ncbi:somatostatin receptor type 5-like [Syngnathoides biaculeatus]|uniref:somatostatin receptor type 5-like n=1 Tax=Syngnathoides biaculeatus TaxID=300417 RepID=UPI002ADD4E73|nr:somatostatin receptor type 5-like [Syngnathoides biaculeatus]
MELIPVTRAGIPPSNWRLHSTAVSLLFNITHNYTDEGDGEPFSELGSALPGLAGVFIPLIYAVVCVVGLVGNTLVIHVVVNHSHGASATNIYILNLAVADELFMLGLPFLAAQNALLYWPFGSLLCRVVMTVDAINQFTSIFCLAVMSVDRYLAVAQPVQARRWRRPPVAKAVSATVWAGSFVVVLPVVMFADVRRGDGDCGIVWPEPVELCKTAFIVYTFAVGFCCPLVVICMSYLLIVIKIRSVSKRAQATSLRRRRSERKVTRMVVVVVAVFVLCWFPFYALNIINLLVVLPGDLRGLYFFVLALSYANSCANPILYAFLSDNFKRGFRKALCRASRQVRTHERADADRRPPTEWGGMAMHRPRSREEEGVQWHEESPQKMSLNATQGPEGSGTVRTQEVKNTRQEEGEPKSNNEKSVLEISCL